MPSLRPRALRRSAEDPLFSVFLVTVVLCLLRARDLPSASFAVGGTGVAVGPADVALGTTLVAALIEVTRSRELPSPRLLAVVGAFALLILGSALPNGAAAIVSAGKLVELSVLTLGAAVFLKTHDRLNTLLAVLVAFVVVAAAAAALGFIGAGGGRQGSFVGEHDLALLGNLALGVGLGRVHASRGSPGVVALVAIVAGVIAVVLGASLAGLLGLLLLASAIVAVSIVRRDLRVTASVVTAGVIAVTAMGIVSLRQGELGFLQSWFGPAPERPGEYAASWSQRLIYAYIGGRVFLDRPVLGTGWNGTLPPSDFARYVPDARTRFSDQPPHYFPTVDAGFLPQQTYDQVLYQLGLVGASLFAAILALTARRAVAAARLARQSVSRADEAYLPLAALGALGGALAGSALFGGSPVAALFWLVLGIPIAAASVSARQS